MGVKDLTKFLTERAPEAFVRIPLSLFAGKRIAIDSTLFLFACFASAYKDVLMRPNSIVTDEDLLEAKLSPEKQEAVLKETHFGVRQRIISFVCHLFRSGVTPVFVFDGDKPFPLKEKHEHIRRARTRQTQATRISALKKEVLSVEAVDPFFVDRSKLPKIRSVATQNPPVNKKRLADFAREVISSQCGCAVVTAPNEGEKMCAYLCKRGFCAAVWTTDSDSFPLGVAVCIRKFASTDFGKRDHEDDGDDEKNGALVSGPVVGNDECGVLVEAILCATAISQCGFSKHADFVDFCILLGCDLNKRVPGLAAETLYKSALSYFRDAAGAVKTGLFDFVVADVKKQKKSFANAPPGVWEDLEEHEVRNFFRCFSDCESVRIPDHVGQRNECDFNVHREEILSSEVLVSAEIGQVTCLGKHFGSDCAFAVSSAPSSSIGEKKSTA